VSGLQYTFAGLEGESYRLYELYCATLNYLTAKNDNVRRVPNQHRRTNTSSDRNLEVNKAKMRRVNTVLSLIINVELSFLQCSLNVSVNPIQLKNKIPPTFP